MTIIGIATSRPADSNSGSITLLLSPIPFAISVSLFVGYTNIVLIL